MLTANLRMAGMQAISASIWLQNQWQGPSLILLPVFAQLLLHFLGLGFHWNSMAATAPLVASLAFALGSIPPSPGAGIVPRSSAPAFCGPAEETALASRMRA